MSIKAMVNNRIDVYDHEGNLKRSVVSEVDWQYVREHRDRELSNTDWWALKDLTMSQAKKNYRIFLRDLPSAYETPQAAIDAWMAYEIPE